MTESFAQSDYPENLHLEDTYSNSASNNNTNNHNRRQKRRPMQTSSQDARYSHRSYQQQQQQQSWYPPNAYYEQQYYSSQPARAGGHFNHNYQHHYQPQPQYRRGQQRHAAPSRQINQQVTNRPSSHHTSGRSTGEVENLRSTLIEQLLENTYECMICIIKINRDEEIWSCDVCYKMFHLTCIRKWANSEESGTDKNWRCPGCQYSYSSHPNYKCFCHKRTNPVFQPGEIPHSCGERCAKRLNTKSNDCNHHCTELCHPGPCPTCTTMVKRSCLCGRESQTIMCSSNSLIKCENKCGKLKSCQHHYCELVCHPRECEPCDHLVKQVCSSHGTEREVPCTVETGDRKIYTCGEICEKLLECGQHRCTKICHDGPCTDCLFLPENCKTCACGKTTMDNQQRMSCIDPLPTCDKPCDKILSCGPVGDRHRCSAQCHNGPCPPCKKESTLQCRCGQLSKSTTCIEAVQYDPIKNPFCCERRCNRKKLCGKHRCNELCCDRDIHVCELVCGKPLNCGIHTCEELCHKNPCRKCPINVYDELSCRCGQTVLQPPIECGTKPPSCNYKCNRTHACDHPVYHSCHNDDECPPCTHLVSKMCVGEHTLRNNVPCHLKEVLCGLPCGKPLSCGVHTCQRACHSGPCQANDQKCTQLCSIKRRECGHPCNLQCHGREPCPSTTCREKVEVRCPCGRLVKDVVCNIKSSKASEDKDDADLTQSLVQALSVRTIDLSLARKQKPAQPAPLECDDDCRIIQRNKNLAQALSINTEESRQSTVVYTDFLRDYAKKNLEFVQGIERQLGQLVEETQRHRVSKRCYSFKPMKINERHVVHELASFYGLETHSMDPEPHRNVVAYASYGVCKIPITLLTQNTASKPAPGRVRRFFRWITGRSKPIETKTINFAASPTPPATTMQRVKRFLALSPPIERLLLHSRIIENEDLARLISKTVAVTIYAFISVSALGTLGVDTKPLLAGIGITGFTIGFALKEVATNFISGIFLVISKPFVRGCRIKIHGSGGGIEGLVHYIDVRYVHLKTKDRKPLWLSSIEILNLLFSISSGGVIMVPSAVVYTNPFTVFPADDDANAGFIDMTKPPSSDPTKQPTEPVPDISKISHSKETKLQMKLTTEPAGSFKKAPFNEKL
ncbi:unnamed protein product [Adineta ricciae]|uniref:Transcriptional repressor NF-X1 n=1 Tax=Adineta ricciae TaxID=249248 RepID=A0A814KQT4_ADIRI|nr:unnamed protein product [Adineta ricciae]